MRSTRFGIRGLTMSLIFSLVSGVTVAVGACRESAPVGHARPRADVAIAWNALVLEVAEAEDRFLTLKGVRTAAMMHLAMHDALNAIDPRYEAYLPRDTGAAAVTAARARGADAEAAAAQAAFVVAVDQYPDRRGRFETELARSLEDVDDAPARTRGLEIGRAAAERILAAREGDGWDREAEYAWHPMAPGVYAEFPEHSGTPQGFVFGAGWATARPFALEAPDQFLSPPPLAIASEAYTVAYDEVKSVGRHASPDRTADQSHLAMWWKEFVESSHSRLARELAAEEQIDLWTAARLFALLEMSVFDGYVSVFHNKFLYNHWRPYTAIRWAANDGNPATEPDPDWNNTHRHTYAFPSYPSAHGTVCAAAAIVLTDTFGDDRPFSMRIPEVDAAGPLSKKVPMDPPTRRFDSFMDAAHECAMSRLYLGIHFRYDSEEGEKLGRRIGEYLIGTRLRPL